MPLYHSIGTTLVPNEELLEKKREVRDFLVGAAEAMDFSTGRVETAPTPVHRLAEEAAVEFREIGLGKPLTIRITSIYPGDLPPKGGFFGKKRGVLISSAVKSWQTFDAQPRGLNVLKDRAEKRVPISGPAGVEQGTPLVFYSPALTDRSLILTFEMAFDNVDESFFTGVGEIFKTAGGLPIFASAQPYLLAAGVLFNLGGALGNAIFDSRAEFQGTENLFFDVPGEEVTPAGFALISQSPLDEKTLNEFFVRETGELVDKQSQEPYTGEIPYVVIALDGTADSQLETFSATAASAALMKQFYNVREGSSTSAEIMVDALRYYNDFRYREDALDLKKRLAEAPTEDDKKKLQTQLDAVLKNIQTDFFKP